MQPVAQIHTLDLFPQLSHALLTLLKKLPDEDWSQPTVCMPWTVKDVAAHLLGGNLGRLWERSASSATIPADDYAALIDAINRSNAHWIEAAQCISPEILVEFLALTDHRLYQHFARMSDDAPAQFAVSWAGDDHSPAWFDIAREYTEKWLHQQHIREAVGQPLQLQRQWLYPVLDTFLRGLPHAYCHSTAAEGTTLTVEITGEAGGVWTLRRTPAGWELFHGRLTDATCHVQMDADLAWRLFTKGVAADDARPQVQMTGDEALGIPLLQMVSILA